MKILIIQQKMIGDVLTSSILFEALRLEYPKAELHYLIYSHTVPVIANNPNIDKVIQFNDNTKKALEFHSFLKKIRKKNYDVVIDVYAKLGSAITSKYSEAKIRISFDKWYTHLFYTHFFSRNIEAKTNAGPAIEKRLRLLKPIMKNVPSEIKPKIFLAEDEKIIAKKILSEAGISNNKPLLMIAVLGSSAFKTYPSKYLAEILDLIVENSEAQLLFNYIPSQIEEAKAVFNYCNPKTKNAIFFDVFGKNLRKFLALTSYCDALIGNEGGAINMAKALNVSTFAIFSPSVPKENWNMYENGITNVSVHIKDYHPELFNKYSAKELKQKSKELYNLFQPSYFEDKLLNFINPINK